MTQEQAEELGALIRETRLRQGLSYGKLAALSGTEKSWLHKLENGQRTDPHPALLARVVEALGLDPARIDRLSNDHLAESLPEVRTYFRSKEKLPMAALKEIDAALVEIRAKYQKGDTPDADAKARRP